MKLTKQNKNDLANAYRCIMQVSILDMKAPLRYIDQYISENISGYGTAADEKVNSRQDYRQLILTSRKQAKGMPFKAKIITAYRPKFIDETTAQFHDEMTVQLGDKKSKHFIHLWMSTVFKYQNNKWQMVLFHGSAPDAASSSADTFHLGEAQKKLKELEKIVDQRTIDLQLKNRDLEIETSLEKVRAIAMGMKEPADMLTVCKTISLQLQSLGVKEIRNVQTAIFYDSRHVYMNYEYYAKHDKTITTETSYTNHSIHKAFAKKMLKGKGEIYVTHIKGTKIKDWIQYQKTTNVFIDKYLNNATSLNYYWHSLGPVALGISTYVPLSKDEVKIFQRFLKVFELAYLRYLDIEKAEAQAREAQIELALERVRARTMAMKYSEELAETVTVMFEQFKILGEEPERMAIEIVNEKENLFEIWATQHGGSQLNLLLKASLDEPHVMQKMYKAWKQQKKSITIDLQGTELEEYFQFLKKAELPVQRKVFGKRRVQNVATFSKGILTIITPEPQPQETIQLLERFAAVFDGTYTRFLDLQKAEVQAREAQIETALERVRSRTMAMHKSEELLEVIQVVSEQLQQLNFYFDSASFAINKKGDDIDFWLAVPGQLKPAKMYVPYVNNPVMNNIISAINIGEEFLTDSVTFEEKNKWLHHLFANTSLQHAPDERKKQLLDCKGFARSAVLMKHITLSIVNHTGKSYSEEDNLIFIRFAKVFEQTYTRFLDLQKAEAQAKEAKIETSLERIRAKAMAMHHSDELDEVLAVLFEQFDILGINPVSTHMTLINVATNSFTFRETGKGGRKSFGEQVVAIDSMDIWKQQAEKWRTSEPFSINRIHFPKESLPVVWQIFHESFNAMPDDAKIVPEDYPDGIYHTAGNCKFGYLGMNQIRKATEDEEQIVLKFATEFGRLYQRFLDLKKAEAQSREAQIELGLERVRARAMAMQKSGELSELVDTVFKELTKLDFALNWCIINIIDAPSLINLVWAANPETNKPPESYLMKFEDFPFHHSMMKGYQERKTKHVYVLEGKEKKTYDDYLFNKTEWRRVPEAAQAASRAMKRYVATFTFSNFGGLQTVGEEYLSEENLNILSRFGKVFDLTYTRFNDLQKAEAQARESQIEASLERVRSKTMAMHNSKDVGDTVAAMFDELLYLGVEQNIRCGIGIINDSMQMEVWTAYNGANEKVELIIGSLDMSSHRMLSEVFLSWKNKESHSSYTLAGEDEKDYYRAVNNSDQYPAKFDIDNLPKEQHQNAFYFRAGFIYVFSPEQLATEAVQIFKQFAKVFEQTYTRYLDLQKAEANTREAQIEASLERVRSKAMAMHKTEDLNPAVSVVFDELSKLNIGVIRCGISVINKEKRIGDIWVTSVTDEGTAIQISGDESFDIHPLLQDAFSAWVSQTDASYTLEGANLLSYYQAVKSDSFKLPDLQINTSTTEAYRQYCFTAVYHAGGLFAFSETKFTNDEKKVMKRFANVFDLTYKRFLDIQKAEAQAREAQIETALERVRSRTLAMQKSDELSETAAVLFQQLIALGIEPNRLYISIIKSETDETEFWITDEDGNKVSTAFTANMNDNITFQKMYNAWKQQRTSLVIDMQGEELQNYFSHLTRLGVPFKDGLAQKRRVQDIAYFSKGFIGMASTDEQPAETLQLLERFAAVFNLTFTRFNDLKIAEAHAEQAVQDLTAIKEAKQKAEQALTELQSTQKQLVQSEKMASLGELTAGIAHEIQNPLNFVNNFSEVSSELLDEMLEEAAKGNYETVKTLLDDVKQNLEKINHHGKRADGIVKGMLQHSRSSSGQMEPTDINVLADEYLRLAYHGLRAKDKSFNATLKTDYDESLPKVNVIPQDIGRVILNLITNAFYAVGEKRKNGTANYEASVMIKTLKFPLSEVGGALISISDNGNGIPKTIIDKIFQPFFTTKPTGQGTGLGLSLAYDIVKAHGGELKVETKEGTGSTFTILIPCNNA